LGVPLKVAENITVPEPVTFANMDEMKHLVSNGPQKWPGALFIIRHDKKIIDLSML
jgi:DNA-directed RNA polymerase subunit A'